MRKTTIGFSPIQGIGVFATRGFKPDEEVLRFHGRVLDKNNYGSWIFYFDPQGPNFGMHWVQVSPNAYLEPQDNGQYVNHSCEPNCGVRERRSLVARRVILPDDEITFDYAMTDADYFSFLCLCRTERCRGLIRGFNYLPPEKREEYRGFISEHLLENARR